MMPIAWVMTELDAGAEMCIRDRSQAAVQIAAPSAILMEASTGQVIYEKGADEKRSPASVTDVYKRQILAFLFNYSGQYIVAGVAERTMHDLRMAVDKKIRRLPLAYFDSNTFGDVLSRVTNDVDTIDTSLQQSISQVITAVCTMVFIFVMMQMCIRDRSRRWF